MVDIMAKRKLYNRIIDGKKYNHEGYYRNKEFAENYADMARKRGYSARIIKNEKALQMYRYSVWVRYVGK